MITNNWRKIFSRKNLKLSLRCAGGGTRNTTNGTGVLLVLVSSYFGMNFYLLI